MVHNDLTNAEWQRLVPLLPAREARRGRCNDHRMVINGVLYQARTGLPWRELPERFGCWITVSRRHRRWSADGTWRRLLTAVQAAQAAGEHPHGAISVDSTIQTYDVGALGAPACTADQEGKLTQMLTGDPVLASLAARLKEVVKVGRT
jgi:transposase